MTNPAQKPTAKVLSPEETDRDREHWLIVRWSQMKTRHRDVGPRHSSSQKDSQIQTFLTSSRTRRPSPEKVLMTVLQAVSSHGHKLQFGGGAASFQHRRPDQERASSLYPHAVRRPSRGVSRCLDTVPQDSERASKRHTRMEKLFPCIRQGDWLRDVCVGTLCAGVTQSPPGIPWHHWSWLWTKLLVEEMNLGTSHCGAQATFHVQALGKERGENYAVEGSHKPRMDPGASGTQLTSKNLDFVRVGKLRKQLQLGDATEVERHAMRSVLGAFGSLARESTRFVGIRFISARSS